MWHTLRCIGFAYYEVFVSTKTKASVAYITKARGATRYNVFFCDGKHKQAGTRGSMVNARAYAAGMVAEFGA